MLRMLIALTACASLIAADPGTTTVATWKDGKTGAFVLIFDDGMPSQLKHAIPEMTRRGIVGTFYLSAGVKWFNAKAWTAVATSGMVLGNHTMSHAGAKSAAEAEADIVRCGEALQGLLPDLPQPRLISFARPGGVDWKLKEAEQAAILSRLHLVKRPPSPGRFGGMHLKSAQAMIAFVDQAVAQGSLEWVMFHGIGGDWLSTPLADFTALLDALVARRDQLWITDTISAQKYEAERKAAKVEVLSADAKKIRLQVVCGLDPALYDGPLTLTTQVPGGWTACTITQGKRSAEAKATDGRLQYDALPDQGEIVIAPRR